MKMPEELMPDIPEKPSDAADDEFATSLPKRGGAFPVTQWSMVLRAGINADTQAHAALESLCRNYWYPLYTFVRRQGRDHHEAEDCTQEFLGQLLAADGLQHARPERGRFRTFLLTGLRNFLTSEWRRTQAAKRGGGLATIPLSTPGAGERFCDEPQDTGLTPEQAFDRTWALGMIDRAVDELRAEYQRDGRLAVFDALAPLVWGNASSETLVRQAEHLHMTAPAFTVALHRARRRLGERLRVMVTETVATPTEIDAELRHLIGAISGTTPGR
jgi:RNA polymerase sigma-70 factor (ECF subfamily)